MRPGGERGIAVIVALMMLMLLSALGLSLVMTTMSETSVAANFRSANEAFYAADAVLERAMGELFGAPDWTPLLNGSVRSAFVDGAPGGERMLPDGSRLNLAEAVNMANCAKATCSDADLNACTRDRPWGANNPRWTLYAYGRVADLLPARTIDSAYYAILLVGDDPSENDGDPAQDGKDVTNPGRGVIGLRAEAFGPRGAHRAIEATVARTDGGAGIRILSWHEVH